MQSNDDVLNDWVQVGTYTYWFWLWTNSYGLFDIKLRCPKYFPDVKRKLLVVMLSQTLTSNHFSIYQTNNYIVIINTTTYGSDTKIQIEICTSVFKKDHFLEHKKQLTNLHLGLFFVDLIAPYVVVKSIIKN